MLKTISIVRKFKDKLNTIGYLGLARLIFCVSLSRVGIRLGSDRRRYLVSKKLDIQLGSIVCSGQYSGLKLPTASNWNGNERGSILLGFYEKEIVQALSSKPERYKNLIVLGAGDGLHAVGSLAAGFFNRCIAFESSSLSRGLIFECARLNSVEEKIELLSEAKLRFYENLNIEFCSESLVLVDIEGAEFCLLDEDFFNFFRHSIIIVENHSFLYPLASSLESGLISRSCSTHRVTDIKPGARSFDNLEITEHLPDNDRWLLCSEGRGQTMKWFRFDPVDPTMHNN